MIALFVGALVVPLVDQAIKRAVRRRLGAGAVALGVFGQLRLVEAKVWGLRVLPRIPLGCLWVVWAASAAASVFVSLAVPGLAWPLGLVLGGALSHTLETTARGSVCDYVCLRFWPAFNLADVALAAGTASSAIVFARGGL
jgi:lipoprotein signal peptidase